MKNDLLIRCAKGEQVERVPVWLMRQAGRILPEYRAVRAKFPNFVEFVKQSEAAAEVTVQPVDILGVDAAIIFSDILVIPEAMGLPYTMVEKKGPVFSSTIQNAADVERLQIPIPEEKLGYVLEAIQLTKQALADRVPLIGFAGAPFTIFCYMVEGSGSKTFSKAKKMLYQAPALAHQLLQKITDSTIHYLKAQIGAGADLIQVFDSWAGILSPQSYATFALPYIKQICEAIDEVPKTVFAKGAYFAREAFGKMACDVVGLDWTMNPQESRKLVGTQKVLQGNLDPCALYADFKDIEQQTVQMLEAFGGQKHIANLGHGVYPDIQPDHVKCFVETVQSFEIADRFPASTN